MHADAPQDLPDRPDADGSPGPGGPLPPGSRVAVAGASGLIGSALTRSLRADGYEVVRLVRRAPGAADEVRWDPQEQKVDTAGLAGCAAVVNLAAAGVASRRWTRPVRSFAGCSRRKRRR